MKQGTFSGHICGNVVEWNDGAARRTGETALYVKGNCGCTVTIAADQPPAVTQVLNGKMHLEIDNIKTVEPVAS
jgi:hypothetical protein